jgi:hypothetical protein
MNKIKPNDKCYCMSGLKYKKCCLNKKEVSKYETGQKDSSEKVKSCINFLQTKFPYNCFIDISDDLTDDNYKDYQLKNYNTTTIMIAEKKESNSIVFLTRVDNETSDIIVMHRGSFRTFCYNNLEYIVDSLKAII